MRLLNVDTIDEARGKLLENAASLLRTSMYEASWWIKGKTKNYHNQTSSAFHIVCRTACSLYLSVLRHNVILNIQLNQGDEAGLI